MMKRKRVRGFTNIEVLVAASLVLAVITTLCAMVPKLSNLWRSSRNPQLATHELANQLEVLTSIPESQLNQALENLEVSSELKNALNHAVLDHKLIDDEHGKRLVLSLQWERVTDSKPIAMVAWLPIKKQGAP